MPQLEQQNQQEVLETSQLTNPQDVWVDEGLNSLNENFDFKAKYDEVKLLNEKSSNIDERDLDERKENDQKLFTIVWEINQAYWLNLENTSLDLQAKDWTLQINYRDDREGWAKIQIIVDDKKAIQNVYENSNWGKIVKTNSFDKK